MPHYVLLMKWTDQGVKAFKESVNRSEAARAALQARGIALKDIYWTIGTYDLVCIAEAPDDATLSAALLELGSQGNLRTTTLRGFTADEFRSVIQQAANGH
jgi:uncharacterized protein with GYD domain